MLNGHFLEKGFLPISYTVDVSKKTPSILDNAKAVSTAFFLEFEIRKITLPMTNDFALTSVKLDMVMEYRTADIQINGLRGADRKSIGSKKFDNESKYWADFSFAVPLRQIKDFEFKDNSLFPKPVERTRIYGLVNIFPLGPVDTKSTKVWRLAPS